MSNDTHMYRDMYTNNNGELSTAGMYLETGPTTYREDEVLRLKKDNVTLIEHNNALRHERAVLIKDQIAVVNGLQEEIENLRQDNKEQGKTIDKLTDRLGIDDWYLAEEAEEVESLLDEIEKLQEQKAEAADTYIKFNAQSKQIIEDRDEEIKRKNKEIKILQGEVKFLKERINAQGKILTEYENKNEELEEILHKLIQEQRDFEDDLANMGFYKEKR